MHVRLSGACLSIRVRRVLFNNSMHDEIYILLFVI